MSQRYSGAGYRLSCPAPPLTEKVGGAGHETIVVRGRAVGVT